MNRGATLLRRRIVVLLAAALLASCTPAATPDPSGAWVARWEPRTAWERALATLDPATGTFARDDALRLFATAFGPLPGVDVQQDLTGITDRTIAIAAVKAYESELTEDQRAAIDAAIAPPPDSLRVVVSDEAADARPASIDSRPATGLVPVALARARADPAAAGVGLTASSTFAPGLKEAIEESVATYRTIIAAKLGMSLSGKITVNLAPQPKNEPNVLGQAWSKWPGGVFGDCEITVFPLATDLGGVETLDTLAHEVFHCFQFDGYHSLLQYAYAPRWVIEGQAAWVGETLAGGDTGVPFNHWRRYLTLPWLSLTGRVYDAIGFYSHLAESGIDPWTRFRAMWGAGSDSAAAFVNSDAEGPSFLESWGSSIVREAARGASWDTTGPSITEDSYFLRPADMIGGDDVRRIATPEFTADAFQYEATADMVRISIPGQARLSDGKLDTTELAGVTFCVEGHDCSKATACPGEENEPQAKAVIGSRFVIGISGGVKPMTGTIRGIRIGSPDECPSAPPETPPPPSRAPGASPPRPPASTGRTPCQSSCGQSNGDVHIDTFGAFDYDFQGVGEFVVARSADGRFEVQTRQAPFGDSKVVSINTAVAVKAGGQRMALYVDVRTNTVRLSVNGLDVPMAAPVAFGAGLIVPSTEGVRIDTGDGSYVDVIGTSHRGLNLLVEPGVDRLAGIVGLMGLNAKDSRWPALPDGSAILPYPFDRHTEYAQLYETLAPAWRVTPASSLFDYAPGESTDTFTNQRFPAEVDFISLADLTPAQRAAGEEACAGVTDPDLHDMCVFDVGVTSDFGYGDVYETTIRLRETGELGFSGERVRIVNLYANDGRGTDLDVYAWAGDAANLGDSGTGPVLVTTVPYGQSSDWFDPGRMANGPFAPVTWISVQRHGEPVNTWQLNLFDLGRDVLAGLERTFVLASDRDGFSAVGGTPGGRQEILEQAPESFFPLIDAPAGKALAFLDAAPMSDVDETQQWAASVDGTCLADPDFPTLVRTALGDALRPVVLEPGSVDIAVHEFPPGADSFDLSCARLPIVARTHVTVAAGDRVHLFIYAESATAPTRLLALRVGD
ncbi:MAG TPA: hypothetical protein VFP56_09835 [Candidatus Limnocylindrales bacterium]|nr:hypothetical protein [Candidatus Limnocylindrales bacterium]